MATSQMKETQYPAEKKPPLGLSKEQFYQDLRVYLASTNSTDWNLTPVVNEHGANALDQHISVFAGNDELTQQMIDWIDTMYADQDMWNLVLSGGHSDYRQSDVKERALAYFDDLHHDRAENTMAKWHRQFEASCQREAMQ